MIETKYCCCYSYYLQFLHTYIDTLSYCLSIQKDFFYAPSFLLFPSLASRLLIGQHFYTVRIISPPTGLACSISAFTCGWRYFFKTARVDRISFILNKNRKFLFTKIPVYVNKPAGAERIPGLSPGHFPPLLSCQKNNKGQKRGFSKHRAISSSVIFTRLIKSTLYSFSSVLVFTTFSREKWFFSCLMCKIQTFYCLQSSFFLRTLG